MATNSSAFTLPAMYSNNNYTNTSNYNNTGQSFVADRDAFWKDKNQYTNPILENQEQFSNNMFVDSGNTENEWASTVWDWANSEQGSQVIGSAIGGAATAYSSGKSQDLAKELSQDNNEQSMTIAEMQIAAQNERHAAELAQQMKIAEMAKERVDRHNKTINDSSVKMNTRNFK